MSAKPRLATRDGLRTAEEIDRQLQARLAELEKESAKPALTSPCEQCRWFAPNVWEWQSSDYQHKYAVCVQPLVLGFDKPGRVVLKNGTPRLCGPEKALFEPRRNFFQWLRDWFLAPWRES